MRVVITAIAMLMVGTVLSFTREQGMTIAQTYSMDSLGACQGISFQHGSVFLYGDRETGIIREYKLSNDSLVYAHKLVKY